jgi:Rieske Fe-S protein
LDEIEGCCAHGALDLPHAHAANCCEEEPDPIEKRFRPSRRSMLWLSAIGGFLPNLKNRKMPAVSTPTRSNVVWIGSVKKVRAQLAQVHQLYVPEARAYLMPVNASDLKLVKSLLTKEELSGASHGFLALHQKCPHLGCKIPFCESSGWFECPCHGSQFAPTSERRAGPAPSGMSRRNVVVRAGRVGIDLASTHAGFATTSSVTTNAAFSGPNGPHCVGG